MYNKTKTIYHFEYLCTGVTGAGIRQVYLPDPPPNDQILFKKENRFIKPQMSEHLREVWDEIDFERNRKDKRSGKYVNPRWEHPTHQQEANEWEDQEWERSIKGVWFWNKGKKTYITGPHYKYLTSWDAGFEVQYRETDKEVFYWIQYWEEDPKSFGGCLNTLRRGGKSSIMGFWIINRTSTNKKHLSGMQGEDDKKIFEFYDKFVMNPFYKLPPFFKPTYNLTTLQRKGIEFTESGRRNVRRGSKTEKEVLESSLDYRTSEENKYDHAKLHSYVMEEPGKTNTADVWERWGFVKPCLQLGVEIIGRSFLATTVEYMDVSNKGGKAYQKLCLKSDYDVRDENGETISGLYAALVPADCAVEGFFDEWGHPKRKEAADWILKRRRAVENSPKDYASLVRKYPMNWREVFYVSAEHCEFNIIILQDRKSELLLNPPAMRRFELDWENKVRFSRVVMKDSPTGWWKTTKIFTGEESERYNNVARRVENGRQLYSPLNDAFFEAGLDPIDHGVIVSDQTTMGDDGFVSSRKSRPVLLIGRKYDSAIDGVMDINMMIQRAREKYPYKTGYEFAMMDQRPSDPNIFFERTLMVAWLLGVSIGVESQKPGVINWFNEAGCGDFIWLKYVPNVEQIKRGDLIQGTPASQPLIQEYTSLLASDVEYFGHCYPFIEVVEDLLQFDPNKTREYDYAVAKGWMKIAGRQRPKRTQNVMRDIKEYFRTFNPRTGQLIKMSR